MGIKEFFCQYDPESNRTLFYYATLKDGVWQSNPDTVVELPGRFSKERQQSKCMNMAKGVRINGFF
ncbi:hypothetical protein CL614_02100 [archaeon]|nr:hypothetical protein [archaeon]|tara:strand:+ start:545 stop:742 length:198 start_codon:yes stop_codon:yes gene_type:complete